MKTPFVSVVTVRLDDVPELVTVTVAPGRTLSEPSTTDPLIWPVRPWAYALDARPNTTTADATHAALKHASSYLPHSRKTP